MLHVHELTRRFDDVLAVDRVTFDLVAGEVLAVLGPNGAGKTTTVRMLAGLIAPSSGTATVAGHDVRQAPDLVRSAIGILTETPGLYGKLDAVTNLTFFARMHRVKDTRGQVERYLRLFGLWDRRREPVDRFSKGMKQKLALARALLHEPPVLFLDEPSSGLDPEMSRLVRDAIARLRDEGRAILLCTHNLAEAEYLADRVAVLRQRIVALDRPEALRERLFGGRAAITFATDNTNGYRETAAAVTGVICAEWDGVTLMVASRDSAATTPSVVRALVEAGAPIRGVSEGSAGLEDVYLALVREEADGGADK